MIQRPPLSVTRGPLVSVAHLVALGVGLSPAPAHGEVLWVEGFLVDTESSGEVGCLPGSLAKDQLLARTEEILEDAALDPDFVVVMSGDIVSCPDLFYVEVKNDVTGIGYQHHGAELFDLSPGTALQGIAFLNDLPYWLTYPEELQTAFLHEIGHRWLARVHAELDGRDVDLTGRQGGHWSYFLDTQGSPLEGNAFPPDDPLRADSPAFPLRFSPLDLYLMGAVDAADVPPFRLIEPSEGLAALDCWGNPVSASSPPQTCGPLDLVGSTLELSAYDVIEAEGPRHPARMDSPQEYSVTFVLMTGKTSLPSGRCHAMQALSEQLPPLFSRATGDRMRLSPMSHEGTTCDELTAAPEGPAAGCQLSSVPGGRRPSPGVPRAGLVLGLLSVAAWMGARLRVRPSRRASGAPRAKPRSARFRDS